MISSYQLIFFASTFVVLVLAILALLHRSVRYDRQIRRLLQKQQNFDLVWSDLKTHRMVSKGDHSMFRKWGFPFSGPSCRTEEIDCRFSGRMNDEIVAEMKQLEETGAELFVSDHECVSPLDGERKYYRRFLHPLGKKKFMLCVLDTTAQREAEKQQQLLDELFESIRDGLLILDRERNVLRSSRSTGELFPDFDPEEPFCFGCLPEARGKCPDCHIRKTMQDGRKHSQVRFDGSSERWIELSCVPIRDIETGEIGRVLEFIRDITEQHDREEDLQRREKFLSAIHNASHDGIGAFSDDGVPPLFNTRLIEMFGGDPDSRRYAGLEDLPAFQEIPDSDREMILESKTRLMETYRPQTGMLHLRDDLIFEWHAAAIRTGIGRTGHTRIWTFHDVTEKHRVAELVRENERRFRTLFASMRTGLLLVDVIRNESGRPVDYVTATCNPAYAALFHRTVEEVVGRSLIAVDRRKVKILSHDFGEEWWKGLELASRGYSDTYHVFTEESPASFYLEITIFPVNDNQIGLLVYDETYRVLTEQSLGTMQKIVDHLSEPVFWIDCEGTIQYTNEAAAKAFGFEHPLPHPDGPIGRKVWAFDTRIRGEHFADFAETLHRDKSTRFETVMMRNDQTTFPAEVVVDLMDLNGRLIQGVCFHDLTEQIRRIEAEQASIAKSKFLDHMTHEIRTPLNAVIGIADMLLGTELEAKQREYVELARMSGRHLLALVNNILDYSKIDTGNIELERSEFDLPQLIESVLDTLAAEALQRNLELCGFFLTDLPRNVVGDPRRLRQILLNLLSNGLKFTSSGGVVLTVSQVKVDGLGGDGFPSEAASGDSAPDGLDLLQFEVMDTGIGISEEKMGRLFESFSVGDASFARKYGGTGLGLAIAKELIEMMGGKISVESTEKVGSRFRFQIPLILDDEKRVGREIVTHKPQKSFENRILLVVGNPLLRSSLSERMEAEQIKFHTVSRIQDAVRAIRDELAAGGRFRTVVVDRDLEDGTGLNFARKIHEEFADRRPEIVLIVPIAGETFKEKSLFDLVDRLIPKPIFGPAFFEAVFEGENGIAEEIRRRSEQCRRQQVLVDSPVSTMSLQQVAEEADAEKEEPMILVVEDNRINRIVAGEILKQAGYRLHYAENGRQACEAVASQIFSLVLMDCQMPVMDGFEATLKIRDMENGRDEMKAAHSGRIPIVALTANALQGDQQHCLDVGMDDFCSKPINADRLLEIIRNWISVKISENLALTSR